MVLALTMPALNKVEVHLVEKSEQVNLKIKVENEAKKIKYLFMKIKSWLQF